jgi:ATP-dependent exoDNAse (exonuclease V) alpha subunit
LDNGRKMNWKLPAMPHVEHAYAMTSYSLQSKTSERTLLQIDTGDSRIRTLLDKPLLYVGASRGNRRLVVFTDDKESARRAQSGESSGDETEGAGKGRD